MKVNYPVLTSVLIERLGQPENRQVGVLQPGFAGLSSYLRFACGCEYEFAGLADHHILLWDCSTHNRDTRRQLSLDRRRINTAIVSALSEPAYDAMLELIDYQNDAHDPTCPAPRIDRNVLNELERAGIVDVSDCVPRLKVFNQWDATKRVWF